MSRTAERIALLVSDFIAVNLAFLFYYYARFYWGWLAEPRAYPPVVIVPMMLFAAFWLLLFLFSGLYRGRFAASRFDELITLLKVVTVGILILFFVLFIDDLDEGSARATLFFYWASVFGFVALGRVTVRSIQKALVLRGKGVHRALIVGWGEKAEQLYQDVAHYPAAGLEVVGFLRLEQPSKAYAYAGVSEETIPPFKEIALDELTPEERIAQIPALIDQLQVQDVLIALGPEERDYLMEILRVCEGKPVSLKLVPDFYHVISGMARTEHLYGLPLIEVLPEPMPPWEQSAKRMIDVLIASTVLILGLPLWVLIGFLIKVTSKGPVIYRQQRVGKGGATFTMYKFRTMYEWAEAETGPVWAQENDPRYTPVGRWLRRWRLDEIPQLWNVLKGEMSLVGPRPERPYFVEQLEKKIPLYMRRHRVRPGITGLAQVNWKYDSNLDDVRRKVKFDLFYIANMSLRMDFKILLQTIKTLLSGKGR